MYCNFNFNCKWQVLINSKSTLQYLFHERMAVCLSPNSFPDSGWRFTSDQCAARVGSTLFQLYNNLIFKSHHFIYTQNIHTYTHPFISENIQSILTLQRQKRMRFVSRIVIATVDTQRLLRLPLARLTQRDHSRTEKRSKFKLISGCQPEIVQLRKLASLDEKRQNSNRRASFKIKILDLIAKTNCKDNNLQTFDSGNKTGKVRFLKWLGSR